MRTRRRGTAGGGCRTFPSAFITRWPSAPVAGCTSLGGYTVDGVPQRSIRVLERGRWRALPRMPFARAAAGAAVAGGKIIVAGGVTTGATRLARNALSFDLRTRRWSVVPGPTPREHLGVASLGGIVYAVAGRTSGLDTNLIHFESYRPGDRSWRRLPPVPDPRGGTGAAGRSRPHRLRRRRGARRDDRGGARVPRRRTPLGPARRPADAAPRRRRRSVRWACLRDRRRPRARPHRQHRERVSPACPSPRRPAATTRLRKSGTGGRRARPAPLPAAGRAAAGAASSARSRPRSARAARRGRSAVPRPKPTCRTSSRPRSSVSAFGKRSASRFAEPRTAMTNSPRRIVWPPSSTSVAAQRVIVRSTGLS